MMRLLFRASAGASGRRVLAAALLAAALLVSAAFAGETRNWTQSSYADFEKGVSKNLSLRSDGLLTLAPRSREILDTTAPYLWALAQDSKGNLYAGGGTGAKLHRIAPDGKSTVIAEFEALEIHAIAVDSKDRVYVATSPDGKVYRVTGSGKPEIFYEPGAKYIWAMALNSRGDLFVATGDDGEVHRVTPDGAGKVFFKVDEAHVRAMTVDAKDYLVIGTEPGGLVLRVSPAGEGFVLYQMPRREVTAVAVAPDGSVYAAAVGNRPAPSTQAQPAAPAPISAAPAAITVINPPSAGAGVAVRPVAPPSSSAGAVTGGTEVYRIEPGGYPRRMWGHAQDLVYAIAFDASGRAILGAGNKGNLYRIESPTVFTALLAAPATQITAFQTTSGGRIYAATGNPGKVFEIGPGVETEGSLESDVFDTKMYSTWGRLSFEAKISGGSVAVAARAGNVDAPQRNWSAWSTPVTAPEGARTGVPGARFIQWKATLKASPSGDSPEVEWVEVAYLPKNVEPRVDEIEMTAPNYRFPAAPTPAAQPAPTLTLPPLGARTPAPPAPAAPPSSTPAVTPTTTPPMQLAKGFVGARWVSSDPNGDAIIHTVEIRGAGETTWKLLKDKLNEKYYSWDSTTFADGEYRLRITASDLPANPPAEALVTQTESEPFIIDNTPPRITGLTAARSGSKLEVRWRAADALNTVVKAEYSLDGGEWTVAAPVGGLSDAKELDYVLSIEAPPGEHTVAVRARDDYDNETTEKVLVR